METGEAIIHLSSDYQNYTQGHQAPRNHVQTKGVGAKVGFQFLPFLAHVRPELALQGLDGRTHICDRTRL
jgi:hypothetical protein